VQVAVSDGALGDTQALAVTVTNVAEGGPIVGTAGNDNLSGTSGGDTISGLGGNDVLLGLEGDDTLIGGSGSDQLYGGPGRDTLDGGNGADYLYSLDTDALLQGGGGIDFASIDRSFLAAAIDFSVAGTASVAGQTLPDGTVVLSVEQVEFRAGSANDRIVGGNQDDALYGGDGADTLDGGGGRDWLVGGPGDDTLFSRNADYRLEGGIGIDYAYIDRSATTASISFSVEATGTVTGQLLLDGTVVLSIERVEFHSGAGDDLISCTAAAEATRSAAAMVPISSSGKPERISSTEAAAPTH
jgi:Ca2+-binding RTX toxin-like protein